VDSEPESDISVDRDPVNESANISVQLLPDFESSPEPVLRHKQTSVAPTPPSDEEPYHEHYTDVSMEMAEEPAQVYVPQFDPVDSEPEAEVNLSAILSSEPEEVDDTLVEAAKRKYSD
jgi:hypothetical protein